MKKINTATTSDAFGTECDREPLVTVSEVAKFLAVTPGAIKKWRLRGELPFPAYAIGRAIRYRLSEVEAYVHSQAHRNAPEARALRAA